MVERSHHAMANILRALVAHFVGEHRGRWGVPCVQYHLRHLQFASSSTTPFQLVHAWAAATPMQRSLAPWALVPKELPCEDWVQELVATWRKITDRFAAYLQDYEAKAAGRRDSKHTWVTYRSRVISSCWSAIRWRGTLRESWASAWKVRAEAAFALRVPCGPRGDGWPGDGATPGGDTGVATSRLLRVPAGAWDPLRLDDVVVPVTEKPLSEADHRSYAQFPLGRGLARGRRVHGGPDSGKLPKEAVVPPCGVPAKSRRLAAGIP